jgi:4-alpha-glucanotransferase
MNLTQLLFSAPFPPGYRASGILLHVTSLPSPYGIGDLGPSAFAWIDLLAGAGQTWWQMLPLGPTGPGHSPYQALSSFAVSPLVISPDQLLEDGLLDARDCGDCCFPSDHVDFEKVAAFKGRILSRAWQNFRSRPGADLRDAFERFREQAAGVLAEPALYMALREKYQGAAFTEWPIELARREPGAVAKARQELAEAIDRFLFGQFVVLRQWGMLKEYANRRDVRLLGDLPIFVSAESSDVWAHPELFLLDRELKPRVVAGVPPDYFSADGQRWDNAVYDWNALRSTGYRWWIDRIRVRLSFLDAIRVDHFRGFEAAWHIPVEAPTAAFGQWVAGPGADFFQQLRQALGALPLLAEDLGVITPAVTELRDRFQLPGMRVLQFAFNGDPKNPHLPQHYVHNCVAYTGTHDNDTTRGWYDAAPEQDRSRFWSYLQRGPGEPGEAAWEMIRLALSSEAALAVFPLQDLLGLGSSARMNIPGRAEGQWVWRCTDGALEGADWQRLRELTKAARRMPQP